MYMYCIHVCMCVDPLPNTFPVSCSSLPADGIILRPCPKDQDGTEGEAGLGGGVASAFVGGASIHDESFEDEFSDMEGSVIDGNPGIYVYTFVHAGMSLIVITIQFSLFGIDQWRNPGFSPG